MRRLSLAIAGLFILVASSQAQAQVITFTAQLHGGNEIPVVVTGSVGTATVTWNTTAKTGTYAVTVYNMPVATTAAHIHVGAQGGGGPVVVNFTFPPGAISNDYAFSGTFACSDVVNRPAAGHQLVPGLRAGDASSTILTRTCTRPLTRAARFEGN